MSSCSFFSLPSEGCGEDRLSIVLGVKGRAKVSRSKSRLRKTFLGQDSMGSPGGVVWWNFLDDGNVLFCIV